MRNGLPKARDIDEYVERLPDDQAAALTRLRKQIQAAAPKAEECISYSIPAFRLDGRVLVYFHAAARHCSFFPGAYPIEVCAKELKAFSTSKGTVRFTPDKPISAVLVKKLVKARVKQHMAKKGW